MAAGLSTPLLDFFRRGEAARDLKLTAAQGAIAPRPVEQLGILALLAGDHDAEVRKTAEETLAKIPVEVIAGVIARSDAPTELREFFVQRGIAVGAEPLVDAEQPIIEDDLSSLGAEFVQEPTDEAQKQSLVSRLAAMSVPDKVKAAMKGSREVRAVLVRDPNKMVSLAVLSSPKLTETEIESFARMGSVAEDVLRTIAQTRAWTKNYNVVVALVKNAKTPVAMTLNLLNRLVERDIRAVSIDRNVPEPLRIAARRKLVIDKGQASG